MLLRAWRSGQHTSVLLTSLAVDRMACDVATVMTTTILDSLGTSTVVRQFCLLNKNFFKHIIILIMINRPIKERESSQAKAHVGAQCCIRTWGFLLTSLHSLHWDSLPHPALQKTEQYDVD